MLKKHLIIQLVALCALMVAVFAAEKSLPDLESGELSLQQLIEYAFACNPGLKAAKSKWSAVIEKYPQATAYKDPLFRYTYMKALQHMFSLSQEFPFPGNLGIMGEIVDKEVKIARIEFERQSRDLIVELKQAYYELVYLDQAIELTLQNKATLEHLAKLGATEYSMDKTTLNDVLHAQAQLSQVTYDLTLLNELKSAEITRINSLLNRAPEAGLSKPQSAVYRTFAYPLDKLYSLAQDNQQELAIADLEIERWGKKLELAQRQQLPDFMLELGYVTGEGSSLMNADGVVKESDMDAYLIGVGITIPWWFGKNQARIDEARFAQEAVRYRRENLENKINSLIKSQYVKIQNTIRLIQLYQNSLIPQAADSLETAQTWFKTGKGSFSGVLETQSVWLNFNLAHMRALADYYQRLAMLEKLVGANLPLGDQGEAGK